METSSLLSSVVFYASPALGAVLILALLTCPGNRPSNRILAMLILIVVLYQSLLALIVGGSPLSPYIANLAFPVALLIPAVTYLYFRSITNGGMVWSDVRTLDWGLVPVAVVYYALSSVPSLHPYVLAGITRTGVLFGVALLYFTLIAIEYSAYASKIKERVTQYDQLRAQWLKFLLWIFGLFFILRTLEFFPSWQRGAWELRSLALFISLFAIAIFALRYSTVFALLEREVPSDERRSRLSSDQLKKYENRLRQVFIEEKPYLNPDLRLIQLAEPLGVKAYQLSEVLNRGMGTSFFDFVNRHRVDEAKRRLSDPSNAHLSILGIALDCGFNSKSSFAEAFRRWGGTTPSSFRAKASQKKSE